MAQTAVELALYEDLEVSRTGQLRAIFTSSGRIAAYEFSLHSVKTSVPRAHLQWRLKSLTKVRTLLFNVHPFLAGQGHVCPTAIADEHLVKPCCVSSEAYCIAYAWPVFEQPANTLGMLLAGAAGALC